MVDEDVIGSTQNIYPELCEVEVENDDVSTLGDRLKGTLDALTPNTRRKRIGTIMTLLALVNRSESCTNSLYMNTVGQVCNQFKCEDTSTYLIPLSMDDTLCFKMQTGETMKLSMQSSDNVDIYYPSYKTFEYDINVEKTSRCKGGAGSYCWNNNGGGNCKPGSNPIGFKSQGGLEGYDCTTEGLGCDTWCFHQMSCTWYHWYLTPKQTDTIYEISYSVWEIQLAIEFKGQKTLYSFSTNKINNIIDVNDLKFKTKIPITIISRIALELPDRKSILESASNHYYVDSAKINFPVLGLVGEVQMSLDEKTSIMSSNGVKCEIQSCIVTCVTEFGALAKVKNGTVLGTIMKETISYEPNSKLIIRTPHYSSINLMIGNLDIKNLFVSRAYCSINIIASYGCTSGTVKPY